MYNIIIFVPQMRPIIWEWFVFVAILSVVYTNIWLRRNYYLTNFFMNFLINNNIFEKYLIYKWNVM